MKLSSSLEVQNQSFAIGFSTLSVLTRGDYFTWQVLREKHNGKYEKAVTPSPAGNDWFHAKIIIEYPKVTVYVNGNPEPSLVIDKLNDRKTGKIGLWVGNTSDGDFANLQITNK